MITAQVESFTERLGELKPLLPLHWEELALNKDKVPLDPEFDKYIHKEACGEVMFVTLRKDAELIGYFIGFVGPGLHYRTCMTLIMDIFYLSPKHRDGSAMPAIRLFREVEKEARRRGVQRWVVGSKLHKDASRLFQFLGFEPIETVYSKWIGD